MGDDGDASSQSSGSPGPIRRRSSGAHLGEKEAPAHDDSSDPPSGMPDFDIFPEFLRVGPWHLLAKIYLTCFGAGLAWYTGAALESLQGLPACTPSPYRFNPQALRGLLLLYCTLVNVHTLRSIGLWPYLSYTMVAYALLNLRLVGSVCGFDSFSESIRFPVLVMAAVTTTVWWLVLVPLMLVAMPHGDGSRKRFLKFNFSAFLINVHLLNLPTALLDTHLTWRPLVFWDLWLSFVFAFAYLLLYLFVLDANGMHFYIILSPRPWWCIFMYSMVLGIYFGIYAIFR